MRNKSKPAPAGRGTSTAAAMAKEMVELFNRGEWVKLEKKARLATICHPAEILGWKALGKALLKLDKLSQAEGAFSRVLKLSPADANAHNELGWVFYCLGRKGDAERCYRRALELNPRCSEAHCNLGTLLSAHGRFAEASSLLHRSLEINPHSAASHNALGIALRGLDRLTEAEASFRRAIELNPHYFEAWMNSGLTLNDLQLLDRSQESYRSAARIMPESDQALQFLGIQLDRLGRIGEAVTCLERSIELNPGGADAYRALGNLLLRAGDQDGSMAMFRRAQQLRPFSTEFALRERPEFSVLLLDSPGPGSTPLTYLTSQSAYDRHFYCVLPDAPHDLDLLRSKADVVVNMIADADSSRDILPLIRDIVDRLGRPTLNHPELVKSTDRETIARRLAGIPLCHVPKTKRLAGSQLTAPDANGILDGLAMPLLIRLAGKHGGDEFEKLSDLPAIAEFASRCPEADYYLTEYADYRSADGFFRKYRLISINGELLPYHLAIHDHWKVHHFRTDMANQAWMREEEEAFLREPQLVFNEAHRSALLAVAAASGLDYCGIDCALDGAGRIVVFETNASMLVHDEKDATFAYKNSYIARIKAAFAAKLAGLAAGGSAGA